MNKNPLNKTSERRDERNAARLGIISIQARVDTTVTHWRTEFEIEGKPYRVEAFAPAGRPHGVDTDVILAVQTLYVRQGCLDHEWIHTTAYELRELSGLPNNGHSYTRLRESLDRLWVTGFKISEGWHDQQGRKKWDTDTMRYIERVKYRENDVGDQSLPDLDERATLSIKLGSQVAESIRDRFIQVLDGRLLHQLEQPPSRALYRLLESHRVQQDGTRLQVLSVNLHHWAKACGITSDMPFMIRRTLQPAHEELMAEKYLQEVTIEGRGKKQQITYTFTSEDSPDLALVELLVGVGLNRTAATELARLHPNRVEEAVQFVRKRKAQGLPVKNMAGMVRDVLLHPDKYLVPEEKVIEVVRVKEDPAVFEEAARQEVDQELLRIRSLTPEAQWAALGKTLKLLMGKNLTEAEYKQLAQACQTGVLVASELHEQVIRATGEKKLENFYDLLREKLLG